MAVSGFELHPEALAPEQQAALLAQVRAALAAAPPVRPDTPWGKPMSVLQTSFGPLGWVSDRTGYRYQPHHPVTGGAWPPMPAVLLELWARYGSGEAPPDSCLVNIYGADARMGLHRDADEADRRWPVLSVSLGDSAVFRIGGLARRDPTATVTLRSGDVCVLKGEARMAYHGIDRVLAGSSRLAPDLGRLNLTLAPGAVSYLAFGSTKSLAL